MSLVPPSQIRSVNGLTPAEHQRIYDFLQGAAYCYCKNNSGWFGLRDIMGGANYFWQHTPLEALWNKHKSAGLSDPDAEVAAGQDGGWILKRVLDDDRRTFRHQKIDLVRKYEWTGDDGVPVV